MSESSLSTEISEMAVCCLACGVRYMKPVGHSVADANPGCPACGYLGWVLDSEFVPGVTSPHVRLRGDSDGTDAGSAG